METKEEILQIWRKRLFRVAVIFVVISLALEIVIYLIESRQHILFLPNNRYRMRFLYIPSALNLLCLGVAYLFLTAERISGKMKNAVICLLLFILCANMQTIHYVYGSLITLPIISIFITVVFADKILTLVITILSNVSLFIAGVWAINELRAEDEWLATEVMLGFVVIWVAYITARMLSSFVDEQFQTLINSSKREHILVKELELDVLTGLENRKAMDRKLNDMTRNGYISSDSYLAMLDVDHFKRINDTYGHMAGDEVLISLAEVLKSHNISNVFPYRVGGDEFIIVLREKSKEMVDEYINVVMKEFQEHSYSFADDAGISVSVGVAAYQLNMSGEEWMNEADKLLYVAKRSSRNVAIIH